MIALPIVLILSIIAYFIFPILTDCLRERNDILKSDTEKKRVNSSDSHSELDDIFLEPEKFL